MPFPFECSGMRRIPMFTLLMLALAYALYGLLCWGWSALDRGLDRQGVIPLTLMVQALGLAVALWLIFR